MLSALALLLPLLAPQAPRPRPSVQGPDVLLVILDDVAQADVSPALAPTLAALAADGTMMVNAYACSTCHPTRRAIYSGRWWVGEGDDSCGASAGGELDPADSLAALFPGSTGLFGKWHCGSSPSGGPWEGAPLEQGFDVWGGTPSNVAQCGGTSYTSWVYSDGASSRLRAQYEPLAIRDELVAWWVATPGPRLAVWGSGLAHSPFHRPPAAALPPGYPATVTAREKYEAMIASADYLLASVLAVVGPDTLVIVVGDNGTPAQVAPDPDRAKGSTFQRGVRVPMVLRGPGVPRGFVSSRLVHVVDLMPTILAWAGSTPPPGLDGVDLRAVPRAARERVLVGDSSPGEPLDRATVSARWKMRRVEGLADQLYDLLADPLELVDRAADPSPEVQAELEAARAFLDAVLPRAGG